MGELWTYVHMDKSLKRLDARQDKATPQGCCFTLGH